MMMKRIFRSCGRRLLAPALAGAVLLTWSAAVWAQSSSSSGRSSSSSSGGGSGFTGGSGGSGFTGGSGGSGFTGGSGGSGFTGGSGSSGFTGSQSTGMGAGRGASTTGTGPTQSNFLQSFYANPMASGLQTNGSTTTASKPAFGTALYKATTTTTGSSTYGGRGGSSLSGYASATTSKAVSGSTQGMRRDAAYATVMDFSQRATTGSAPLLTARADLQQVIARSTSLTSKGNINVVTDGSVVVLQGTVASDAERRLAEGLVRLTPHVYDVRNELQVGSAQATTTAGVEKKP